MTINEFNFAGKKAIVRVDFNVPLDENGKITDDTRISGALPTLKKILADGGATIIMSHMGKPKGKVDMKKSLGQIREAVEKALGVPVAFAPDCAKAADAAAALKMGEALLLENLRFYPEEEGKPVGVEKGTPEFDEAKKAMKASQKEFAKTLASYADCYVMDAFGTAHRKHASTAVIADYFDANNKMLGLLMEKEVQAVDNVLSNIKRPLELDKLDVALGVEELAKKNGVELVLGSDCTATNGLDFGTMTVKPGSEIINCPANKVPAGFEGVDAGPASQDDFRKAIKGAKTILWNGPAGVFECDDFTAGSRAIGEAIAEATAEGAFSLIGGGDSVACVNKFGLADKVSYISTGGGALLEAIEGKVLPGVAAIKGE